MSKVFRLYRGNNTILDWDGNTNPCYGSNAIGQIPDPDAKDANREITSIPSPFARIDLVKNAYAEVVKSGDLHGTTIFHKTVSDSLDIAQIFFNLPKLTDKVKVIVWDKEHDLDALLHSPSEANRRVGETLDMFFQQDAQTYHFNQMRAIYLLHYFGRYRKTQLDIIGATSPATLFFSSANDFSYLSEDIQFGQDKVFDNQYSSLGQRDDQFILFYYAYRRAYPRFASLFKEVDDYMDLVYRDELTLRQKDLVDALNENSISDYPELLVRPNRVEINGVPYRQCPATGKVRSGFEIASDIVTDVRKPLVLPIEAGTLYTDIHYVSDKWERTYKAPYQDNRAIEERSLPKANETYPYLTISDFLEDTLIRVSKQRSDDSAFFSQFSDSAEFCYLLPLKPTFFNYFTIDQLKGRLHGMKMIEVREVFEGNTEVTLRIPIQNGRTIEYRRQYIEGGEARPAENKGRLIERDFAVGLFSNLAYDDERLAFYRVSLISDFEEKDDYTLSFWKHASRVIPNSEVVRNKDRDAYNCCRTYVLENKTFDMIRVNTGDGEGVLLPSWQKKSGNDCFTFAIDLGTTNTHVEYCIGNGASMTFDMTGTDSMFKLWGHVSNIPAYMLAYDMIPQEISSQTLYHFPMRTALCEAADTNWNRSVFALADANIPFPFEKKHGYAYDRIVTNLKWSNDDESIKRVQTFIDSLFLMLRTKVLLNNGALARTKIVWFYPISMVKNRYDNFCRAWNEAYVKYFGGEESNVISMTESVAPYEHFKTTEANVNNIVTIDIGGGTTDIVVAKDDAVEAITSFHFAADSIFGDSYTSSKNSINSLVSQYESRFRSVLAANQLNELLDILEEHSRSKVSANLASFFFSLKDNHDVRSKNLSANLDFNSMLQRDEKHKIVFILFYAAIIYHLASMLKAKKREMPRHIAFSGNGSKVIRVLSTNTQTLETFTKKIFEKVYEQAYPMDGLTILQNESNPKEVTCKGGLSNPVAQPFDDTQLSKVVFRGDGTEGFFRKETYAQVNDKLIAGTVAEATRFLDFVMNLNMEFSFKRNFGIEDAALAIADRECRRDLITFTNNGLKERRKEVSDTDSVEETFFFYPITGMLTTLITNLYK